MYYFITFACIGINNEFQLKLYRIDDLKKIIGSRKSIFVGN